METTTRLSPERGGDQPSAPDSMSHLNKETDQANNAGEFKMPPVEGVTSIRYRSLDPNRNEVRLLELQPAVTNDISERIVCRLVHERLNDSSDFIGLSALYGDVTVTETTWLNGSRIAIPLEVARALRHVRAVFLKPSPPPPTKTFPTTTTDSAGESSSQEPILAEESSSSSIPPSPPSTATTATTRSTLQFQTQSQQPPQPSLPKLAPSWLRSLFRNFRYIRTDGLRPNTTPPLRIWLDLVCINRANKREESERRAHMARAYRRAKTVVGWLGLKDPTSDLAITIIRSWDKCMPPTFGEPGDREVHPDDYAPVMQWMAPVAHLSQFPEGVTDPRDVPSYKAISELFNRSYFRNAWILEDMSLARFPSFLLGDNIVSWMQILRLNRVNEEIKDHGAAMFPDELRPLLDYMPLGTVYMFLKEFEKQYREEGYQPLFTATRSIGSSNSSFSIKK